MRGEEPLILNLLDHDLDHGLAAMISTLLLF